MESNNDSQIQCFGKSRTLTSKYSVILRQNMSATKYTDIFCTCQNTEYVNIENNFARNIGNIQVFLSKSRMN